jgi:transcriptional regulator with XRE-family HTH domain
LNYSRDEIYLKQFGKNLKKIRLSKSYTQEELSLSSDVSLAQITRLERGIVNPTI